MIISEQEKNRIRSLHRNYSVIKEQIAGQTSIDKLTNCAGKVIPPEEILTFSSSLSVGCGDAIISLMKNKQKMEEGGTPEISMTDLTGAFACLKDVVSNEDTLTLIVKYFEPMLGCMAPTWMSATAGMDAPTTELEEKKTAGRSGGPCEKQMSCADGYVWSWTECDCIKK